MRGPTSTAILFGLVGLGVLASPSAHATSYDEAVNGDLSGDRANPTQIPVTIGSNTITATSSAGDVEYFHLAIPTGLRLTNINVISNTSTSLSFIGVQRGTTFTEPPTGTNVANLLGYSHFGPANGTIGTDILDDIGRGAGAQDFTPPLAAGDYTFWSQETSGTPSTYTLSFVVAAVPPAPIPRSAMAAIAIGLALLGARYVRRMARARRLDGTASAGF